MRRLVLLFIVSPMISAGAQTSARSLWNSLDNDHRRLYVMGVADGMGMATGAASALYSDSTRFRIAPRANTVPFDSALKADLDFLTSLYGKVDKIDAVVEIATELYADPANTCIPLFGVVMIAAKKLSGERTATIDERLTKARRGNRC